MNIPVSIRLIGGPMHNKVRIIDWDIYVSGTYLVMSKKLTKDQLNIMCSESPISISNDNIKTHTYKIVVMPNGNAVCDRDKNPVFCCINPNKSKYIQTRLVQIDFMEKYLNDMNLRINGTLYPALNQVNKLYKNNI